MRLDPYPYAVAPYGKRLLVTTFVGETTDNYPRLRPH